MPRLVGALAGTALFIFFLVSFADPTIGFILVVPVLIFSFLFVLISILVMKSKRAILLLSASGMIILTLAGFAASSWQGSPQSVQGFMSSTNCIPIEIPNATSPSGYVVGDRCTTTSNPFFNSLAIGANLLFWFLVSYLVFFAMPVWEKSVFLNKITRNLFGAGVAAALLFLVLVVPSGFPYPPLSALLLPVNPYSAFAMCDSSNFMSGQCVTVNIGYLLLDYSYWVVVCSIAALTASEFYLSFSRLRRTKTKSEPLPSIPAPSTV